MGLHLDSRRNLYRDTLRTVLVRNVGEETIPPFAVMEIVGFDAEREAFLVDKPSRDGATDVLINGPGAIDPAAEDADASASEGQATPGPLCVAAWADDGSVDVAETGVEPRPAVGDYLGTKAGEWFLVRRRAGFRVAAVFGKDGDKLCIVRPNTATLVEHVEITGCQGVEEEEEDGPPLRYSPAKLVWFDPTDDEWVYPPEDIEVWYRDETGNAIGPTGDSDTKCRIAAILTGHGFGRTVYLGRASTKCSICATASTTTTTTTPSPTPCTGECTHTWNSTTKQWSTTGNTCSTGCNCFAPVWCPEPFMTCVTTKTACGEFTDPQPLPNCTGTTTTPGPGSPCNTTTTTTTPGPECTVGCTYYCDPFHGWIVKSIGCSASCPCPFPPIPCAGVVGNVLCTDYHTDCTPTTTTPSPCKCCGSCQWAWDTDGSGDWVYVPQESQPCFGQYVSNPPPGFTGCRCDKPTQPGSECAQRVRTGCYLHGGQTPPDIPGWDPCGRTTTTTTPSPGTCTGQCLWGTSDGGDWDIILRPCPGCGCNAPNRNPTGPCDTALGSCVQFTTTTTTTTTPSPCGGACEYTCSDSPCGPPGVFCPQVITSKWILTLPCPQGCNCPPDSAIPFSCFPNAVGTKYLFPCEPGPTTTTSTTTTPSADCNNQCVWACDCSACVGDDTESWVLTQPCVSPCTCRGDPLAVYQMPCNRFTKNQSVGTPCEGTGTTTSTTTTPAPTTTTSTTTTPSASPCADIAVSVYCVEGAVALLRGEVGGCTWSAGVHALTYNPSTGIWAYSNSSIGLTASSATPWGGVGCRTFNKTGGPGPATVDICSGACL